MIGVGVIGMGFMGRTHARTFLDAAALGHPCHLRAICDSRLADPAARTPSGNIASTGDSALDASLANPLLHTCTRVEDLLADSSVNAVSICTHTPTHVSLAMQALASGKHVLLEKPVALTSRDAHALADAAERAHRDRGLICLPAMCIRFWPAWEWLHDRILDARYGSLRSLTLQRLGSRPSWGSGFYADDTQSGGALFDLHVHDTDFVYWCFGRPSRVSSTGTRTHLTTLYHFNDALHVAAEGAWDLAPATGFRMRYLANFESATAEFNLAASPQLTVHERERSTPIDLSPLMGYDFQTRHFLDLITSPSTPPRATMRQAAHVLEIIEAEAAALSQ